MNFFMRGATQGKSAFEQRVLADGGTFESSDSLNYRLRILQQLGLKDIASLLLTSNGYKGNKLYSAIPSDGSADFEFTRSGQRNRTNTSGLLETVESGIPALDYTYGDYPSWSFDPTRTNLFRYSEDFSNAVWSKTNVTVDGTTEGPDGVATSGSIIQINNSALLRQSIAVTAQTTYTASFYVKRGTFPHGIFKVHDNNNLVMFETFDYYDQTNSDTYTRIIHTFTTPVGCNSIAVYLATGVGTDSGTVFLSGAMINSGTFAAAYVKTTSATVTTSDDRVTPLTNISNLIGQEEGTLLFSGRTYAGYAVDKVITLSDGTTNNRISLSFPGGIPGSTKITGLIVAGGVTQASVVIPGSPEGAYYETGVEYNAALTYGPNYLGLTVNGETIGEDLSLTLPSNLSRIGFDHGAGSARFYGSCAMLYLSKTKISKSLAEQATTPLGLMGLNDKWDDRALWNDNGTF